MNKGAKATVFGLLANILLFVIKIVAGLMSNSLAIISDAINSLQDIITSSAVMIGVQVSRKRADTTHPFGHRRAEPVAGLIVAIFAAVLGFEVIRRGVVGLFYEAEIIFGFFALGVMIVTMLVKSYMFYSFKKISQEIKSPAIFASAIDSRNDVLTSLIALIGFVGGAFSVAYVDTVAAIIIGLFIIYSGYLIGVENIDYLIGKGPSLDMVQDIKRKAKSVAGVKHVHDVKAHYVGDRLHVQVHIELDKRLSLQKAHTIGKKVEDAVGSIDLVAKVFVHIDPVT